MNDPMRDTLNLKSHSPLIVNEAFLKALDSLVHELDQTIKEEAAAENRVTVNQIDRFLAGNMRGLTDKKRNLERAAKAVSPRYEVEWENGVTSKRSDIEEIIGALRRESAAPITLSAAIGEWSNHQIDIKVNYISDPIKIHMTGTRENIEKMRGYFHSLVTNFQPDMRFLHFEGFALSLAGITFTIAFLSLALILLHAATDEGVKSSGSFWLVLASVMIGILLGRSVFRAWKSAYPFIDFQFGIGRAAKFRRKAFIVMLTSIFVPVLLASVTVFISQ